MPEFALTAPCATLGHTASTTDKTRCAYCNRTMTGFKLGMVARFVNGFVRARPTPAIDGEVRFDRRPTGKDGGR